MNGIRGWIWGGFRDLFYDKKIHNFQKNLISKRFFKIPVINPQLHPHSKKVKKIQ
jgi:hypothetical protein